MEPCWQRVEMDDAELQPVFYEKDAAPVEVCDLAHDMNCNDADCNDAQVLGIDIACIHHFNVQSAVLEMVRIVGQSRTRPWSQMTVRIRMMTKGRPGCVREVV
jgi:hypothetical protein